MEEKRHQIIVAVAVGCCGRGWGVGGAWEGVGREAKKVKGDNMLLWIQKLVMIHVSILCIVDFAFSMNISHSDVMFLSLSLLRMEISIIYNLR